MPTTQPIAFVVVWSGPWPNWIELYWESCRWNPDVDWLFFTDQPPHPQAPQNIFFHRYTFQDLLERFSVCTNLHLRHLPPYKFCDLKATYGLVFQKELRPYVFWGICDVDQSWGRVRAFFSDDLLKEYDILTSHRYSINGQGTLFRNRPDVNQLYTEIPEVGRLLTDLHNHGVDELHLNRAARAREARGELRVLRRRLQVEHHPTEWEDWAADLEKAETGREYLAMSGACCWREGKIHHVASGAEMLLFHYHTWKWRYQARAFSYPVWPKALLGWEMNENKIVLRFRSWPAALWYRLAYTAWPEAIYQAKRWIKRRLGRP